MNQKTEKFNLIKKNGIILIRICFVCLFLGGILSSIYSPNSEMKGFSRTDLMILIPIWLTGIIGLSMYIIGSVKSQNYQDLIVKGMQIEWVKDCDLFTSLPAGIKPILLRKMYFLLVYWRGESHVMQFPLAESCSLASYQYLRCFRWAISFFIPFFCFIPFLDSAEAKSKQVILGYIMWAVIYLGFWSIGKFVNKHEFVRLLNINPKKNEIIIRFNSSALALKVKSISTNTEFKDSP